MALKAAEDILDLELDPDHKHFMAVFTGKRAVIAAVLSATARITPGRLRGQERDGMADILMAVREQRQFLDDLN